MAETKTKLEFTCPACGGHKLQENANVLRIFTIKNISEEEFEYEKPVDGNGMLDAIDHYACANTACGFIIPYVTTVEQMIEWLKDKRDFPDN